MKQTVFLLVTILMLCRCTSRTASPPAPPGPDTAVYYPYAPVYSNALEKGNAENARRVLEVWKAYETGDIRKLGNYFADSLVLVFPDDFRKGKREALLQAWQKRRNVFADVQCYVDAWIPVLVKDKGDQLVYLWGRQDQTAADGRRAYIVLHQIWKFDASGKIFRMEEYRTHPY